jgi:hypothetical protein
MVKPLGISLLALMVPMAAEAETPETWTCAKWLDGREHHQSTTMEIWVQGYLTSSNQWASALGWAVPPLRVREVLSLLDQGCKSQPNAHLADVLDAIQSEQLRTNWRDGKQMRPN